MEDIIMDAIRSEKEDYPHGYVKEFLSKPNAKVKEISVGLDKKATMKAGDWVFVRGNGIFCGCMVKKQTSAKGVIVYERFSEPEAFAKKHYGR